MYVLYILSWYICLLMLVLNIDKFSCPLYIKCQYQDVSVLKPQNKLDDLKYNGLNFQLIINIYCNVSKIEFVNLIIASRN